MNTVITDYGAVGDGCTDCTEAFEKAVAACAGSGGGYVEIPAGSYLTGTIVLKSHVYLTLAPGSVILGSMKISDYRRTVSRSYPSLIIAEEAENTGITGQGEIDLRRNGLGYTEDKGRPFMIVMINCRNITVKDVTLKNTGMFTIYSINNKDAVFTGLKIYSRDCENGDGLDFSGSENVTVSDCIIDTGDDAIGLKTHYPDQPCRNFTITNCVLSSLWAGIRLGPETCGDMINITVSNCVFHNCTDGLKIQLCDSFLMQDITFSNLSMTDVKRPFFITSSSCPMSGKSAKRRPAPGIFRRLLISNVTARMPHYYHGWFDNGCLIQGLPDGIIEDVEISHVHLVNPGGGTKKQAEVADHYELIDRSGYPDMLDFDAYPSCGIYIKNAKNIKISNSVFEATNHDFRTAIAAESVENLRICMTEARNCGGLLRHYRVSGLQTFMNEGKTVTFTEKQAEEWELNRKIALEQLRMIKCVCACLDSVRRLPKEDRLFTLSLSPDGQKEIEMTADFTGTDVTDYYVSVPRFKRSVTVFVDGVPVFEWKRPPHYNHNTPLACRITPENDGIHTVRLTTDTGMFGGKEAYIVKKSR